MSYLPILEKYLGRLRGVNYLISCPFHNENKPSLSIHIYKGIYNCFGCSKSGHIVDIVQKIEKVSFSTAQAMLSRYKGLLPVGIGVLGRQHISYMDDSDLELFMPIQGKIYKSYLKSRRIKMKIATRFDLREGSAIKKGWQKRIIYPIRDLNGNLVSIEGRTINGDEPRFMKWLGSKAAYGILGVDIIPKTDYGLPLFIVEGLFDVMSVVQMGYNAVGMSCSDISDKQLGLLRKVTKHPIVILDGTNSCTAYQRDRVRQAIRLKLAQKFRKLTVKEIFYKNQDPNDLHISGKLLRYLTKLLPG